VSECQGIDRLAGEEPTVRASPRPRELRADPLTLYARRAHDDVPDQPERAAPQKQTTAGLGPFQISDREALLTSYVPATSDGVE